MIPERAGEGGTHSLDDAHCGHDRGLLQSPNDFLFLPVDSWSSPGFFSYSL
jgi:hypothetical protein